MQGCTYPQIQWEALLDLSLEAVRLDQAVAVRRLAALDAARMDHPIPIKPAQYELQTQDLCRRST